MSETYFTKIILSNSYAGFGLSKEAFKRYNPINKFNIPRDDPKLVQIVEDMLYDTQNNKNKLYPSKMFSSLYIKEIDKEYARQNLTDEHPCWNIEEHDGKETLIISKDKYKIAKQISNQILKVVASNSSIFETKTKIRNLLLQNNFD